MQTFSSPSPAPCRHLQGLWQPALWSRSPCLELASSNCCVTWQGLSQLEKRCAVGQGVALQVDNTMADSCRSAKARSCFAHIAVARLTLLPE